MNTDQHAPDPAATDLLLRKDLLAQRWQTSRVDNLQHLSDAIADIYDAIATAERNEQQDFGSIDEAALSADAQDYAHVLVEHGDIRLPTGSSRSEIYNLAVLIRALEELRLDLDRSIEGDGPGDLEDACRTTDRRHYVVSRVSSLIPKNGQPFTKRALLHTRVLPTFIQGFAVRLRRLPAMADEMSTARLRNGDGRRLGAAFFPLLEVKTASVGQEFVVESIGGFDAADLIESQVVSARADGCSAIVWAELTMPEPQVDMVRESLARHSLDGGSPPDFLVAGSWHREAGGQRRNISRILDGSGTTIFELVKWARFSLDGRFEAIVPGTEIPILVTESEVIVMAICRDFLDETAEPPYCKLDVDLAIVPSMASLVQTATMNGHIATARTMSIRYGTQSMIVQQPPSPVKMGALDSCCCTPNIPPTTRR